MKPGLALYRMEFGQLRRQALQFSLSQNEHYEVADFASWLISLQPPLVDKNLPDPISSWIALATELRKDSLLGFQNLSGSIR